MRKIVILTLLLVTAATMVSIVAPTPAQAVDWCREYAESGFHNHAAGLVCAIVLAWETYCGGGYLDQYRTR
jgi:hypothetical protein